MAEKMRGLDDYIMGVNQTHEETVKHTCLKCKHTWKVDMTFDMGGWFYQNDNDADCPKCGNYDDDQIELD